MNTYFQKSVPIQPNSGHNLPSLDNIWQHLPQLLFSACSSSRRMKARSPTGSFRAYIFWTLSEARSRLYRSQILQVNTRWKALVDYTMHSFAPFWNRIQKTRKTMEGKRAWSNPGKTGQEKLRSSISLLLNTTTGARVLNREDNEWICRDYLGFVCRIALLSQPNFFKSLKSLPLFILQSFANFDKFR